MQGKPRDVPGQCNAHLYIADDYGDNTSTMRCQLPDGHDGRHHEMFVRQGEPVDVYWAVDEKELELWERE